MEAIEYLGLLAGACTSSAVLPQLIKTWRTKKADEISLGMFVIFTSGLIMWLIYGISKSDIPVIAANSLALVLYGTMLFLKLRFREKPTG
jgi:MtN3 and saliva related transmembrane protein